MLSTYMFHVWLYLIRAKWSGDIEQDPRPKSNSCRSFPIYHWNPESILVHNFIKLSILRAYITIHKSDVVCLSETYFNASITNDDSLEIPDYLFTADHLPNTKERGVLNVLQKFSSLKNSWYSVFTRVYQIWGNLYRFVSLYCSPNWL